MKFVCERKELLDAVILCNKILTKKEGFILSYLKLKTEGKKLILYSTNLKTYIKTDIEIDNKKKENNEICLPGVKLNQILNKIKDDLIICILKDKIFTICNEKRKIKFDLISYIESEKYPSFSKINNKEEFVVNQKIIKEMILNTMYSVDNEEDWETFKSGIFLEIRENRINMSATDGKRFSHINKESNKKGNISIIIPIEILKVLIDYINEGDLNIYIEDKFISFSFNDNVFYSSIIEGTFPDYKKIILEIGNQKYKIIVNTNDFKIAIDRVCILSSEDKIFFNINKNEIVISTGKTISGIAEEKIKCEFNNDENIELIFNYKYIMDFLKLEKEENVILEWNKDKQVLFWNGIDKNKLYIVMPMVENGK